MDTPTKPDRPVYLVLEEVPNSYLAGEVIVACHKCEDPARVLQLLRDWAYEDRTRALQLSIRGSHGDEPGCPCCWYADRHLELESPSESFLSQLNDWYMRT